MMMELSSMYTGRIIHKDKVLGERKGNNADAIVAFIVGMLEDKHPYAHGELYNDNTNELEGRFRKVASE